MAIIDGFFQPFSAPYTRVGGLSRRAKVVPRRINPTTSMTRKKRIMRWASEGRAR
jgi:hypothetical protein